MEHPLRPPVGFRQQWRPHLLQQSQEGQPLLVSPLASDLAGKQLVLILSSNSDDMANAIGSLAASRHFACSLTAVLGQRDLASARTAETQLGLEQAQARILADLGNKLVDSLDANSSQGEAERQILPLVNALAGNIGHAGSFKDLREASAWIGAQDRRSNRREQ